MVGARGRIPWTWNCWCEIADFEPIFGRSASALIPSEKVQLTPVGSPQRAFQSRWSSYVAPKSPKGSSKTQNGRFRFKIALRLKKVCYKVSLCEKCQRQRCKAFIGLTIRAKMIGGVDLSYLKLERVKTDRVWAKSPIFNLMYVFSPVAPQP